MMDDPLVPRVVNGMFDLKASMRQREVYALLGVVMLALGYEPNACGVYSYRKFEEAEALRHSG